MNFMKIGFDNDKYLKIQSEHIKDRIAQFGDKLYLEFGGKLFDDYHASRVLPGFQPDSKLKMLVQLADCAEVVIVISATDIEKNKVRSDLGITYDMDVIRLCEEYNRVGLMVSSVVITHYAGQSAVNQLPPTPLIASRRRRASKLLVRYGTLPTRRSANPHAHAPPHSPSAPARQTLAGVVPCGESLWG